jgi:hypothetical protein
MTEKTKIFKKLATAKVVVIVLAVVCAAAVGVSVVLYRMYTDAHAETNKQTEVTDHVKTIAEVPDEQPVIVSVSDKDKLSNKQLAGKVANGDTLLMYAEAKRLVIYRPSTQKIVDMLSFDSKAAVEQPKP